VTWLVRDRRRWAWPILAAIVGVGLLVLAPEQPKGGVSVIFELRIAGVLKGEETDTFLLDKEGHWTSLSTSGEFSVGPKTLRLRSEATFGLPDLALQGYHLHTIGQMSQAEFAIERQDDHFVFTTSGSAGGLEKELPADAGTILLDNNIAGHYQVLIWCWRAAGGGTLTRRVVVPQAGREFEGRIEPGDTRQGDLGRGPFTARRLHVSFGSTEADVWLGEATGDLMQVTFHGRQRAEFRRKGFAWSDSPQ